MVQDTVGRLVKKLEEKLFAFEENNLGGDDISSKPCRSKDQSIPHRHGHGVGNNEQRNYRKQRDWPEFEGGDSNPNVHAQPPHRHYQNQQQRHHHQHQQRPINVHPNSRLESKSFEQRVGTVPEVC